MLIRAVWVILILLATCGQAASAMETGMTAQNPIIWADVPDPSVVRVGDTYYMTSTTMHMNPGVPIMKSTNLVDWEIVNYVYDILAASDAQTLSNGQNEYGRGSWASSLAYHDGVFYVAFSSQTVGKTFIFRTKDIENGPWERSIIDFTHDMSLLFDDDGRVYLVHGGGDIRVLELTEDATAIKPGGLNQVIIPNASAVVGRSVILPAEGAHIHKIDGMYYIFLITWPAGGMRTQICFRSASIAGPYEGRVVLQDAGIAQGGIIDTPDGNWYALLFGDRGAVGRIPYLVPVTWDDGWPVFGINGKVPRDTGIPLDFSSMIVASDEFNQRSKRLGAYHTAVPAKAATEQDRPLDGLGRELLVNGGFESALAGWEAHKSARLTLSSDVVYSGASSLYVSGRASADAGVMQDLTGKVLPGRSYAFSAKVRYDSEAAPDVKGFCIYFQAGDNQSVKVVGSGVADKGQWEEIKGVYKIPEQAELTAPRIFIGSSWTSRPDQDKDLMDFYVDDVSVLDVTPEDKAVVGENDYNGSNLSLVWQWNHNPDNRYWSLTERPGYLRLINGSVSTSILDARNTLTQRTFGPECSATVAMDVSNMRHGDYAGLALFQQNYGFVGVKVLEREKSIVMVNASSGSAVEVESVPLTKNRVYLKAECDFRNQRDRARFYYSLDGYSWHPIGDTLRMSYTMPHFMGYRFALFNFATVDAGGYVDFDWFRVGDRMTGASKPSAVLEASLGDAPQTTGALVRVPGYGNPIRDYRLGADPYAIVYNGRVYVYMSSDEYVYDEHGNLIENDFRALNKVFVMSSDDLINWTDHGAILVAGAHNLNDGKGVAKWAVGSWAPAAAHKRINGEDKFFLYFSNSAGGIGVLTADSPIGPWRDPLGKALVTHSTPGVAGVVWLFDPAVLVDDDGKAYLYFGGGVPGGSNPTQEQIANPRTARVIQLGDDMISTVGAAVVIEAPYMFEDSGIHKYNGKYYYSYCTNFGPRPQGEDVPATGEIAYMISDSPMGPFTYVGSIIKNPYHFFGVGGNNHHAIFEFAGQWYIVYHAQTVSKAVHGNGYGYRSPHLNRVEFYDNGLIKEIKGDRFGVPQIRPLNPYERVEAETIAWQRGITTEPCNAPGGLVESVNLCVADIDDGDWLAVSNADFATDGPSVFLASVASTAGGRIEIRVDSPGGKVIGTLDVPATGGEQKWRLVQCDVEPVTGVHNIFFIFKRSHEAQTDLFRFDYWQFR